ncbi:hypothetical protein PHLCEN_2v1536 [Hermanssonia centrifuga]|uniref:Uncharacterized protein n=1 Tax=Hermanssonia centrifuga TaxID=98765 RepID=A0A2R6RZQ0_9APHY|nr:hypothetical protein PHLCEN_2v1536 [Hermanssonia centrifuga]
MDPHFMSNLSRLGPVKVDHHMRTFQPAMANQIQHIYEARLQSELEARSPQTPRNHLLAATLEDLLEERKISRTQEQVTDLAKRYNIDVARLENLARFVNTPNVDPESVVKTVDDDGTERVTMKTIWVDPPVPHTSSNTV